TGLWDFDGNKYHQWLREEEITLPEPDDISLTIPVEVYGHALLAGIGIHDSSASLAPYVVAAKRPFVLISTGTWCINMNPFNDEPLTAEELRQDCLCYLSVKQKPVKSSRFFLGHIHDVNVEALESYFQVEKGSHKQIRADRESIRNKWDNKKDALSFFRRGIPEDFKDREIDLTQFNSYEEAYSRLMVDLTKLTIRSIRLIIPVNDPTDHLYITGGFAKNPFFIGFMALAFPGKHVFTSEIDNATSLGAALVIADRVWKNASESLDLGLKEVEKGER
ncbi:MAG: hypothetical protein KAT15_08495, partial [Bacteroidales bacterium]|nr:hypothetical protein [Bacteroidales bacterium]